MALLNVKFNFKPLKTTKVVLRLLFLLVFMFSGALQAAAGGGTESGGGGGDPRASEFIHYGLLALNYMENPPDNISNNMKKLISDIDTVSFLNDIKRLEASLATHEPTLRFPGVDTLDCFNAPKLGCTNTDLSVDIAGNYWNKAKQVEQCTLTLDELFVQQPKVKEFRYRAASIICDVLFQNKSLTTKPCFTDESGQVRCFEQKKMCETVPTGQVICDGDDSPISI